jgi:hypothetical protein
MSRFLSRLNQKKSPVKSIGSGTATPFAIKPLVLACASMVLIGLAAPAAEADLYRWTSPNGEVHYGDNMPSSQAEHGYDLINPATGEVLKHFDRAKTPQEIAAEAAQEQARRAAIKAQEDQARRDRVLLELYGSLDDLERARKQRIAELDALIQQTKDSIKRTWTRTQSQNAQEALAAQKDSIQLRKNLADLEDRRDATVAQFAQDSHRLQQLLTQTAPSPATK